MNGAAVHQWCEFKSRRGKNKAIYYIVFQTEFLIYYILLLQLYRIRIRIFIIPINGPTIGANKLHTLIIVIGGNYQGSHYFEIRGRSDFSFRCWQKRSERQQGEVVRVQGEIKIFLLLYHFSHSRGIIVAFVCYNVLVMH